MQLKAIQARNRKGPKRPRNALDDLLSQERMEKIKRNKDTQDEITNDSESENHQSDVSPKLPTCTGDYDKDIPPSPKVSKPGMKVQPNSPTTEDNNRQQ